MRARPDPISAPGNGLALRQRLGQPRHRGRSGRLYRAMGRFFRRRGRSNLSDPARNRKL